MRSLQTRAFWFSGPSGFNDPFDCAITVADDALKESVIHAQMVAGRNGLDVNEGALGPWEIRPEDVAAYQAFQKRLRGITDDVGLLCLSELSNNLLMWAHYADHHRGFCFGFERSPDNTLGRQAAPVVYQTDYPRLSAADFDCETNPHSADSLWLTKSIDWSYEREWRLLARRGDKCYTIDAPICSIIFGARMNEAARTAVREAIGSAQSVEWYEALQSRTSYTLEIRPVQS